MAATLSPKVTTDYRISSGIARSAVVRLSVAPSVRLTASTDRTSVTGLVKPLLPGAPVQVQRQGSNGGVDDRRDDERHRRRRVRGLGQPHVRVRYRARVVAGKGFAAGLSPVLTVVPA